MRGPQEMVTITSNALSQTLSVWKCYEINNGIVPSRGHWDSTLLTAESLEGLSHVRLFATPWTAAYQAPPSMGFPRQEYWSGVPLPSPGKTTVTAKFTIISSKLLNHKVQGKRWEDRQNGLARTELRKSICGKLISLD